jgi:predicted permease
VIDNGQQQREKTWVFFDVFLPLLGVSAYVFVYRAIGAPEEYIGFVVVGGAMTAFWMNVLWGMSSQLYWEKEQGNLALYIMAPNSMMAILLGMALGWLARPLFRVEPRVAASCFQCAFRFNTYIGLAVAGSVFGSPGVAMAALLFGSLIPLANLGAVWMLAAQSRTSLWIELARNPLVMSTLAGFAWNLSGLGMPGFLDQTLNLLGQSALPAGLLAVGAALRIERGRAGVGAHAWWLGVKLAALPLAAWACLKLLGLTGVEAGVLLLWAALPTASSAYILAVRMGGDGPSVATQITVGTLVSMATIPLWVAALP